MSRFISLVVVFQYCMQPSIWKFLNFDCSWHLIFPTNNDFVVNHNVFNSIFRQKEEKFALCVARRKCPKGKFSHKVNLWFSSDSFDHFLQLLPKTNLKLFLNNCKFYFYSICRMLPRPVDLGWKRRRPPMTRRSSSRR